jgi:hypothetical protein
MGDKTTWTNNGDQSDAQVITDIAAGLDAEMEAVKQIADSKAARGRKCSLVLVIRPPVACPLGSRPYMRIADGDSLQ